MPGPGDITTNHFTGKQGTIEAYVTPGTVGFLGEHAVALYGVVGQYVMCGVDNTQNVFFYISDASTAVVAALNTAIVATPGKPLHLRLAWNSLTPLSHGKYASFWVDNVLQPPATYAGATAPWVSFQPLTAVSGQNWSGSVQHANFSNKPYNPTP